MKNNLISGIRLTLFCAFFFSGIYTLCIYGIAQLAPNQGKGAIIVANGKSFYSNIAQKFDDDKYFSARPSAVNYNASSSGGSNKGPTNPDYLAEVQSRIDTFLAHNPTVKKSEIPSDLVTASGAGLDPHLSVKAAKIQVKRIATARHLSENTVFSIVEQHIEKPFLGFLGTEKVHVLKLNLALDKL